MGGVFESQDLHVRNVNLLITLLDNPVKAGFIVAGQELEFPEPPVVQHIMRNVINKTARRDDIGTENGHAPRQCHNAA